jgi:hypothetical protein
MTYTACQAFEGLLTCEPKLWITTVSASDTVQLNRSQEEVFHNER